jgi:dTDP-4-dehydrorhamnose reductase
MLGADLSRELEQDYELYGIDIRRAQVTGRGARRYYPCDVTDGKALEDIIGKIGPDAVIHAAAWTDVDGCELEPEKAYKINGEGTKNAAQACKRYGAALIYISTDFVFDGKKTKPYKETDRPNPISAYGASKLKGEEAVRKTLKKYFILRTSWLYGKYGKNFVDTILAKTKSGKAPEVVDDQSGSPTYTKDLAGAIRALLDTIRARGAGRGARGYGIYHVSNSGRVSWCEYAREILKASGRRTKVIPISSRELGRPAMRPAMSVLDNSKFEKLTNFKMRCWKSALNDYLTKGRQGMTC